MKMEICQEDLDMKNGSEVHRYSLERWHPVATWPTWSWNENRSEDRGSPRRDTAGILRDWRTRWQCSCQSSRNNWGKAREIGTGCNNMGD